MMMPGGGLSGGKLTLADADVSDVVAGKKFYAGDKVVKTGTLALSGNAAAGQVKSGCTFYNSDPKNKVTGTWVPRLNLVKEGSVTVNAQARINLTVSGYSEYYCFHSDGNSGSLSWSASQGSFDGYTWTGNGYYKKLKGCDPNSNVTIGTFYNHDTGGYARHLRIFAIG